MSPSVAGKSFPDGTGISNVYTFLDRTATSNRLGYWSYFGYDVERHLIAETNANGVVTRYSYCECGALMTQTNAFGTPVHQDIFYNYDLQGNRTFTYLPDVTLVTSFNPLRQLTNSYDGWANRTYAYNDQGLLTNVSNAYGTERATVFDNEDRPLYVTDANGVTVTNSFDLLGRLRTRTYPDQGAEAFGYSAQGLTAYTNQIWATNFFGYDEAGRKVWEANANWETNRYTYDPAGDLMSLTDGKSQTTHWNYDEYGRVTNKLDQTSSVILKYIYDAEDRLTNRWSAAKGNTAYAYDPVGNLTNIAYAASPAVKLQYDPLNRLANMVDASGTNAYTYTAGGQLLTETGPFASNAVTNGYVNRLRVALGLQQPTGWWTNGFGYDAAGRLTNVTSQAGSFRYDLPTRGMLIRKLSLPNSSYITNTYDPVARLLSTSLKKSDNTTLDSATYLYNPAGQRTNFLNAAGTSVAYSYDQIGQLKVADSLVNTEDRGYTYDKAWNLTYRTNNGTLSTFTVDTKNELATVPGGGCTYDSNGNLVLMTNGTSATAYFYDDENRLTVITNGPLSQPPPPQPGPQTGPLALSYGWETEFTYDGLGRLRVRKEYQATSYGYYTLSSTTSYLYDGNRVIQERNASNTPSVSYTRGSDLSGSLEGAGGIGGLLARSSGYSSGNWTNHAYYHADGNGNITAMVDTNQVVVATYRYDPFGNSTVTSGSLAGINVYRFSSKEIHVNSGMYYYLYRFYDPNLQRWINPDPIQELGGLNLYAFTLNNPVGLFDEDGHQPSNIFQIHIPPTPPPYVWRPGTPPPSVTPLPDPNPGMFPISGNRVECPPIKLPPGTNTPPTNAPPSGPPSTNTPPVTNPPPTKKPRVDPPRPKVALLL